MSLVEKRAYVLSKGKYVRNVVGSTADKTPPDYSDWIDAWEKVTEQQGMLKHCCICECVDGSFDDYGKQHRIIGGHVVLGKDADVAQNGASSKCLSDLKCGNRVFIAPICDICNQNARELRLKEDTQIIHLWNFGYNEYWNARQNMNTFEYRGKCGNNISTISGWRKEWRDMYERYAVRGSHLDSWDDKYLRTSAPAVPSAASIASAPAQFCTAAFLRNQ